MKIFDLLFGEKNVIEINGKVYSGSNITIDGNGVMVIDGVVTQTIQKKEITVNVVGDVNRISTTNGDVNVAGSVDEVSTTNGNVEVGQDVLRSVRTTNGSVRAGSILGDVSTVNGNIKGQ